MRKVQVFNYKRAEGEQHFDKVNDGEAFFHQWGVDYEEFEAGPGNYSTAIIEREDGTVENVPVEMIQFIENRGGK